MCMRMCDVFPWHCPLSISIFRFFHWNLLEWIHGYKTIRLCICVCFIFRILNVTASSCATSILLYDTKRNRHHNHMKYTDRRGVTVYDCLKWPILKVNDIVRLINNFILLFSRHNSMNECLVNIERFHSMIINQWSSTFFCCELIFHGSISTTAKASIELKFSYDSHWFDCSVLFKFWV